MARQGYYTNPAEKKLEIYRDFSGGMNSSSPMDNLTDGELSSLTNIDIDERGALSRRSGFKRHISVPSGLTGLAQGYFRYFNPDGSYQELIAVGGRIIKDGSVIFGNLQETRPMEAAQYQDRLFIASGSGLLQYNGSVVTYIEPYRPQPLEALYIGLNGIADDPYNFMSDGVDNVVRIDGVTFNKRYGITNEFITASAYVSKPPGTVLEYKFLRRLTTHKADYWFTSQDWSDNKTHTFSTDWQGDMQLKVLARIKGQTVEASTYVVPKYKIKPAEDPSDIEHSTSTIWSCNRILLHWDRLIIYGDSTARDVIYVSHLKNPTYFPIPNTLMFETPQQKNDGIVKIIKYRDCLVVFTDTSVQALYGSSPYDFKRVTLNTDLGCTSPESVSVVNNHVVFLSSEGIYLLKSVGYSEDKANVERIDLPIKDHVALGIQATSVFFNGQYRLNYPSLKKTLRTYVDLGYVWTKDESNNQNFAKFYVHDNELFAQYLTTGHVVKYDELTWSDDGEVYEDRIETKAYDFGQAHHVKKLKEIQLLMKHQLEKVSSKVYVYADGALVLNPDARSFASVDENGNVVWNAVSDMNLILYPGTTFGGWSLGRSAFGDVTSQVHQLRVSGKCRKMRIVFSHKEAVPNTLLGIGVIFKMKKP